MDRGKGKRRKPDRATAKDLRTWFAKLERFAGVPFMEEGRLQPPLPKAKQLFKW